MISYGNRVDQPVVIMQNNRANMYTTTVTIIPLTKHMRKLPTHVYVDLSGEIFTAIAEDMRAVSKVKLLDKVGSIDSETFNNLKKAVKIQLDLLDE
jgi:mRNA interferase MazF